MSERQFPPSPRKLKRARLDGDSAKSSYIAEIAQLFGVLGVALFQLGYAWLDIKLLVQLSFSGLAWERLASASLNLFVTLLFIPLLVSGMVGIALEHLQNILTPPGGAIWISTSLKLNRFSPLGGVKRIGSGLRKMPLLILMVAILTYISCILFGTIMATSLEARVTELAVTDSFKHLFLLSFITYLLIGFVDLVLSRHAFIKRNRMSRQELLNELKDEEGDPRWKAHMHAMRETMTYHELSRRVKRSKVLVVSRQR